MKMKEEIISIMKNEILNKEQSSFKNSIWFQPITARFIFDDVFVQSSIVEVLIESEIIIFKGYEVHQDEKMLKYVLS